MDRNAGNRFRGDFQLVSPQVRVGRGKKGAKVIYAEIGCDGCLYLKCPQEELEGRTEMSNIHMIHTDGDREKDIVSPHIDIRGNQRGMGVWRAGMRRSGDGMGIVCLRGPRWEAMGKRGVEGWVS